MAACPPQTTGAWRASQQHTPRSIASIVWHVCSNPSRIIARGLCPRLMGESAPNTDFAMDYTGRGRRATAIPCIRAQIRVLLSHFPHSVLHSVSNRKALSSHGLDAPPQAGNETAAPPPAAYHTTLIVARFRALCAGQPAHFAHRRPRPFSPCGAYVHREPQ
jgi:hypothetical protein